MYDAPKTESLWSFLCDKHGWPYGNLPTQFSHTLTISGYKSQLSINGHYGFRTAATHFIEIQQLRLLYHKVVYTKQQLSSNNQVCKIISVRAAANSMQWY